MEFAEYNNIMVNGNLQGISADKTSLYYICPFLPHVPTY